MRLYQIAAVDRRGNRSDHCNRRHRTGLTECGRRQRNRRHVFTADGLADRLIVHIDSRSLRKSERLQIIAECISAHLPAQLNEIRVTGVVQALR